MDTLSTLAQPSAISFHRLRASIAAVAAQLHLSEGTVRNYLSEAIQKLEARKRIEAAHLAQQKGWLY